MTQASGTPDFKGPHAPPAQPEASYEVGTCPHPDPHVFLAPSVPVPSLVAHPCGLTSLGRPRSLNRSWT